MTERDSRVMLDPSDYAVVYAAGREDIYKPDFPCVNDLALGHVPPPEPTTIRGNTDALLSLFGNLLSNAVRYTPTGGRINVSYRLNADAVTVDVADTGIGINAASLGRIFEKFAREPEAERMEAQGLGLGLALVRQMVEAHEGRVEVISTPAQGSTFAVTLPRLPTSPRA